MLSDTLSGLEKTARRTTSTGSRAAVNADRVRELQPMFNGDFVVVLRDGTKVAGSRRYRAGFDMLTR